MSEEIAPYDAAYPAPTTDGAALGGGSGAAAEGATSTVAPSIRVGPQRHFPAPEMVNETLRAVGGKNPFGESRYRCIWGWERVVPKFGEWCDWSESGLLIRRVVETRLRPKYPQAERFHFEVWQPAEWYGSRQQWEEQTGVLVGGCRVAGMGEYPVRGDYESIWVCEDHDGGFLLPTVEMAAAIPPRHRFAAQRTAQQIYAQIQADMEAEKIARRKRIVEALSEHDRPFHFRPHVGYGRKAHNTR